VTPVSVAGAARGGDPAAGEPRPADGAPAPTAAAAGAWGGPPLDELAPAADGLIGHLQGGGRVHDGLLPGGTPQLVSLTQKPLKRANRTYRRLDTSVPAGQVAARSCDASWEIAATEGPWGEASSRGTPARSASTTSSFQATSAMDSSR
jgi:hypothetical protein